MIHINEEKNILRYRLKDDENGAVVYFTLDLDRYELIISGEVTASYKWCEGTKESFIDLMLRCNYDYILTKLGYCIPEEFNLEKSIEKTIDNIKDNYGEELVLSLEDEYEDAEDLYEDIRNVYCCSSESFVITMNEIFDSYDALDYLDVHECIECVEEHPYWLKKSVEYFCEHIKPLLMEMSKNE